ncbi:MAG TPA: hypothetical protein VHM94_03110 [Acidimicrobiia bacterium]|jgi:hypothetical protein|nr:hypothetical protein [Acidimicrobiia bacterium]
MGPRVIVALALVLLAACSAGPVPADPAVAELTEQLDLARDEIAQLEGQLAKATGANEDSAARIEEMESDVEGLGEELEAATVAAETAQQQRDDANAERRRTLQARAKLSRQLEDTEEELAALRLQYDDELSSDRAEVLSTGIGVACRLGEQRAESGAVQPNLDDIERAVGHEPGLAELDLDLLLPAEGDWSPLVSEARRCFTEAGGEISGEEGSLSPGSYAVGEDVAPGRWEARYQLGDDEFCSFTRVDANGEVIASEVVSGPGSGTLEVEVADGDDRVVVAGACRFELAG